MIRGVFSKSKNTEIIGFLSVVSVVGRPDQRFLRHFSLIHPPPPSTETIEIV